MKTLLVITCVFVVSQTCGQSTEFLRDQKETRLVAKVYPSVSGTAGLYAGNPSYSHPKNRATLSGGLELSRELKFNKWYLETGLFLFDWGFKESGIGEDQRAHFYTDKYIYLTAPVTIIYRIRRLYLGAGINASRLLRHYHIADGQTSVYGNSYPFMPPSNDWLFGLHARAGFDFPVGDQWSIRPEVYGMFGEPAQAWSEFWLGIYGFYSCGLGLGVGRAF